MKTKKINYQGHIFNIEECLPDLVLGTQQWWISDEYQQEQFKALSGSSNCLWMIRNKQAFNHSGFKPVVAEVVE